MTEAFFRPSPRELLGPPVTHKSTGRSCAMHHIVGVSERLNCSRIILLCGLKALHQASPTHRIRLRNIAKEECGRMQKEPPKSPKRQYDDPELNDILMKLALDPTVTMLVTLDKSQAGGKHEKALLDLNRKHNLALFNTHVATRSHTPVREFAIGQSATHQICHTKGFVADGKVAGEGSTNWSIAGEGEFVIAGKPGGAGQGAKQHPIHYNRSRHD